MKKLLFALLIIVGILAVLPIIGNKFMSSTIENRISSLEKHGLVVQKFQEQSSYLQTASHYEFVVSDTSEFLDYLNQYATEQIPPYVDALLQGAVIGVDLKYSNIPFLSSVTLDIYPLSFSKNIMSPLKEQDKNFFEQLDDFLTLKGIHYHMDFHLLSEEFGGYLQDVDQKFTLKDGTLLGLKIENAKFNGVGNLIAPQQSIIEIGQLNVNLKAPKSKFVFAVEALVGESGFQSKTDYTSTIEVKSFKMVVDEENSNFYLDANDLFGVLFSANIGGLMDLEARTTVDNLTLESSDLNLLFKNLNYEVRINKLDKELFAELQTLISKQESNPDEQLAQEIEAKAIALLSKGFHMNFNDISVGEILYNKTKDYKGLDFNADINFAADDQLGQKLQTMPIAVLGNLDVKSKLTLSQELFDEIEKNSLEYSDFAKREADKVIFEISYKNAQLNVNGKTIQ